MCNYPMFVAKSFEDLKKSVFKIIHNGHGGTCTIMRIDKEHIAVLTCHHLFKNCVDGDIVDFTIEKFHKDVISMTGKLMTPNYDKDDVILIIIENSDFSCDLDTDNYPSIQCSEGDEIFILGFPFITDSVEASVFDKEDMFFNTALYKHGYIAGDVLDHDKQTRFLLLDIHNNAGFSGSPVCKIFYYPNSYDTCIGIVGVISGYYFDSVNGKPNPLTNSGFAYASPLHGLFHKYLSSKYGNIRKDET